VAVKVRVLIQIAALHSPLDRGIDIENPRLVEQRPHAIIEMRLQPLPATVSPIFATARRNASYYYLTTLLMPSSGGLTAAQRQCRDVCIAPVPGPHR
jgi:hypothetical protein